MFQKLGKRQPLNGLNEFGDLESIKENASSIKGVVGENLRNSLDDLDRNINLVSLKQDVDIQVKFSDLLTQNPDDDELNKVFSELEFATVKNNDKKSKEQKKDSKYETVLSEKSLEKWVKKVDKSEAFAIDTETDSVSTVSANLIGISISVKENEGCYIPIGHSY